MFCKNCGNEIKNESKFCDKCGTPVESNKLEDKTVLTSNVQHQNTDIADDNSKEMNKTDKSWANMSTFEKTECVIVIAINLLNAIHIFNLFGFSISSTGIFLSVIMFFYCLMLSYSVLSLPIWIVDRIIRCLLKIPTIKTPVSISILNIIETPVIGVVSFFLY